jgi:hypothetical protein
LVIDEKGIRAYNKIYNDALGGQEATFELNSLGELYIYDGYIRNRLVAGSPEEREKGKVINKEGAKYHNKGKWEITFVGNAYFNNATISGTLTTVIFEREKIQTMAGEMLICPGIYVKQVAKVMGKNGE